MLSKYFSVANSFKTASMCISCFFYDGRTFIVNIIYVKSNKIKYCIKKCVEFIKIK